MKTDRIREIQEGTAYPDSVSVKQALLQVWNECEQEYANQPQTLQDWKKWEDTVQSFLRSRHLSKDWYDYIKDFKDMPNGAYDQPQTKEVDWDELYDHAPNVGMNDKPIILTENISPITGEAKCEDCTNEKQNAWSSHCKTCGMPIVH